jgi:hypothetical protein
MPFGKFQGVPVADLPYTYLQWLYDLGDELREPLRTAVHREWRRRFDRDYAEPEEEDGEADLFRELIEAGYKALALKFHPDRGGTIEAMTRLNLLMEKLRRRVLAA